MMERNYCEAATIDNYDFPRMENFTIRCLQCVSEIGYVCVFCNISELASLVVLDHKNTCRLSRYNQFYYVTLYASFGGLSLSIVSNIIATLTFFLIPQLRTTKYTIQRNIFACFLLENVFFFARLYQVFLRSHNTVWCAIVFFGVHYLTVATSFWMLSAGLHIYLILKRPLLSHTMADRIAMTLGWFLPLIPASIFVGVFITERPGAVERCYVTMFDQDLRWIYVAPCLLVLAINVVLAYKILRVSYTKIRHLTAPNFRRGQSFAKALLVVVILLGIHEIFARIPTSSDQKVNVLALMRALIHSTHGFLLTLPLCFFNKEVRQLVTAKFNSGRLRSRPLLRRSATQARRFTDTGADGPTGDDRRRTSSQETHDTRL